MCAPTDRIRSAWMDAPTKPYRVTAPYGEDLGVWDVYPEMLDSLQRSGHKAVPLA